MRVRAEGSVEPRFVTLASRYGEKGAAVPRSFGVVTLWADSLTFLPRNRLYARSLVSGRVPASYHRGDPGDPRVALHLRYDDIDRVHCRIREGFDNFVEYVHVDMRWGETFCFGGPTRTSGELWAQLVDALEATGHQQALREPEADGEAELVSRSSWSEPTTTRGRIARGAAIAGVVGTLGLTAWAGFRDTMAEPDPSGWTGTCFLADKGTTVSRVDCDLPGHRVFKVFYVVPGAKDETVIGQCSTHIPPGERENSGYSFSTFTIVDDGSRSVLCATRIRDD